MPKRLLFVCSGNICRSPTAEAIMRDLVNRAGLGHAYEIDSAGTGGWHAGEPPDNRASAAAKKHGIDLNGQAREIRPADFSNFDLIVAMDRNNLRRLGAIAPPGSDEKLIMLTESDIEDPYDRPRAKFDETFDEISEGCRLLLDELRQG